jgi:hypothetical protein
MRGELGEAVLMPARPRLMAERLIWLGAGPRSQLAEASFRGFVRDLIQRLTRMRVRTAALVFPGRENPGLRPGGKGTPQIDPAGALEWFLDESEPFASQLDEVTVLDSHDAQRAMQPLIDRARRRALTEF